VAARAAGAPRQRRAASRQGRVAATAALLPRAEQRFRTCHCTAAAMHGQQLPRQKGEPHRQPPQAVIDHGTLGSQDTRGLRACTGAAAAGRRRTLAQVVGHGAVVAAQDLLDNQTALVAQQVDRRQRRQRHEHQREEHRACAAARAPTRSGPSRPAPTTAGGAPCMRRRLTRTGQGGAACPSLIPSALTARCGAAVRAAAAGAAHAQPALAARA